MKGRSRSDPALPVASPHWEQRQVLELAPKQHLRCLATSQATAKALVSALVRWAGWVFVG